MKSRNLLYPAGLYKGMVWTAGGNSKLLYCGAQDQWAVIILLILLSIFLN